MLRHTGKQIIRGAWALSLVLGRVAVGAAPALPEWQAEADRLMREARLAVEQAVSPEVVARALGILWPVAAPTASLRAIHAEEIKALRREAARRHPIPTAEAVAEELRRTCSPWKAGDEVSFRIPSPRGHVQGVVTRIEPTMIRVDNRWVRPTDLDERTRARFYPTFLAGYTRRETRRRQRRAAAGQENYIAGRLTDALPQAYRLAGYAQVRGQWRPARPLVERVVEHNREKYLPFYEEKIMAEHDFARFAGQWMPAEAIRIRLEQEARRMAAASRLEPPRMPSAATEGVDENEKRNLLRLAASKYREPETKIEGAVLQSRDALWAANIQVSQMQLLRGLARLTVPKQMEGFSILVLEFYEGHRRDGKSHEEALRQIEQEVRAMAAREAGVQAIDVTQTDYRVAVRTDDGASIAWKAYISNLDETAHEFFVECQFLDAAQAQVAQDAAYGIQIEAGQSRVVNGLCEVRTAVLERIDNMVITVKRVK